jgi:hypothetical protein
MKRELGASWRAPRFLRDTGHGAREDSARADIRQLKRAANRTQVYGPTMALFRDPSRTDVFAQLQALRDNLKRLDRRIEKAARLGKVEQVNKLADLIARTRGQIVYLADRVRIEKLEEREIVSRDKLEFGIANYSQEELASMILGEPEARRVAKPEEPEDMIVMRKRRHRNIAGKIVKPNRFRRHRGVPVEYGAKK